MTRYSKRGWSGTALPHRGQHLLRGEERSTTGDVLRRFEDLDGNGDPTSLAGRVLSCGNLDGSVAAMMGVTDRGGYQ
jgi:hypothetical protein